MSPSVHVPQAAVRRSMHPLAAAAAVSVIALSVTGIASMTGLIGRTAAQPVPPATVASPPAQPAARIVAEAPRPVARPVARPAPQPTPAPAVEAPRPVVPVADPRGWATVESVRSVRTTGDASGVGAIAGGVLGGVLGNQVGKGSGRQVATVIGAVGGGVLGHQAERHVRGGVRHEAVLTLDDGTRRTFVRDTPWALQEGERVRIVDGVPVAAAPSGAAARQTGYASGT